MILQALGLSLGATSPLSGLISRVAGPFVSSPEPANRYALGLVLGFLPCGLLYATLAAGAGTASVLQGALAMMAFGRGRCRRWWARVGWE